MAATRPWQINPTHSVWMCSNPRRWAVVCPISTASSTSAPASASRKRARSPFHTSALSQQWRLAFTPPLCAHTQPSSSGLKPLHCVMLWLCSQKRHWHLFVSPGFPLFYLTMDQPAVYNNLDTGIKWLRSWSTMRYKKWQGQVFCSKWHKFMIAISKQPGSHSLKGRDAVSWGGSSLKSKSGGLTMPVISFLISCQRQQLQQNKSGRRQRHSELKFFDIITTIQLGELSGSVARDKRCFSGRNVIKSQ